jgi:hypothetical protein
MDEQIMRLVLFKSTRYNFCIHVDEISLNSVIQAPPPEAERSGESGAYVNLVIADKHWLAAQFSKTPPYHAEDSFGGREQDQGIPMPL